MYTRGFTYVGLLLAVALVGAGLAVAGTVWQTAAKRAKEEQLIFAGAAIRDAIDRYYRRTPGGVREYPRSLDDLVEDRRYITVERHLRKVYVDPMSGKRDWRLITAGDGRITGVYSSSRAVPLKQDNFRAEFAAFSDARSYSDWRFTVEAQGAGPADAIPTANSPNDSVPYERGITR